MAKYGYEFDPFKLTGISLKRENRSEAMEEMANFIKETALSRIASGKSPVRGGPWKKSLSTSYKEVKSQESSAGYSNLELSGDLLDSLDVEVTSKNKLFYGVSSDQSEKAEGNNIGSYGKDRDESKARRFIPIEEEGETFTREIISGMKDILEKYKEEEDNG